MSTKIENKAIEEALNRICSHKLFANSPALIELLKYLVAKSFKKEELNEIRIGSDLYGIDYSENKNNSTVRSYMHKLRTKLNEIYADPLEKESVVFKITKGQYIISFLSTNEYYKLIPKKAISIKIPHQFLKLAGGILLLTLSTFFILRLVVNKPSPMWEKYFKTNAENMLVISDQFMVFGKVWDDKMYGVTYPKINNHIEFIEYTQKHPDVLLKPTDYTMMSKMAPLTVKKLSHWFYKNKSDFNLQFESKLKFEEAHSHNILFVGQYKTMNVSKSLFLKDSKVFSTYGDGFKYKKDSVEKIYDTRFNDNHTVEYAMVSFTSLIEGKSTLYFVSNNDIGVIATLRNFTDKQWLRTFYKQLPSKTNHFNALFKIVGLHRNDISCELVKLETLD